MVRGVIGLAGGAWFEGEVGRGRGGEAHRGGLGIGEERSGEGAGDGAAWVYRFRVGDLLANNGPSNPDAFSIRGESDTGFPSGDDDRESGGGDNWTGVLYYKTYKLVPLKAGLNKHTPHHISSLLHTISSPRTNIPIQSPIWAILRTGVNSGSGAGVVRSGEESVAENRQRRSGDEDG